MLFALVRETRLPSNIERKQKSRISLILEENFEDEDLKNEIDKLMVKMSAESISKKVSSFPPSFNQDKRCFFLPH